jgi:hypothetical protein
MDTIPVRDGDRLKHFGKVSLTAHSPDIVPQYSGERGENIVAVTPLLRGPADSC